MSLTDSALLQLTQSLQASCQIGSKRSIEERDGLPLAGE